jgi:hypothetical protein
MSSEAYQSRLADFPPKNSAPDLDTTALETLLTQVTELCRSDKDLGAFLGESLHYI